MTEKEAKIERALLLIDQMIDMGDAPCGLAEVRRLLAEAQADLPDEDEETVYIGEGPPALGIVRPPA